MIIHYLTKTHYKTEAYVKTYVKVNFKQKSARNKRHGGINKLIRQNCIENKLYQHENNTFTGI